MTRIAVFDFDGTITRKDTFLEFIRFAKGSVALYCGLLLYLPWIVLMKLRLYNNGKMKKRMFSWFFRGMSIERFERLGQAFYDTQAKRLLHTDAVQAIFEHKKKGDKVVIVSASIENWVLPFACGLQTDGLLCTQAEEKKGILTGDFVTRNCYGQEKVNRLKSWLEVRERERPYVIAYGDSRGDKELLKYANEKHYKSFTQ